MSQRNAPIWKKGIFASLSIILLSTKGFADSRDLGKEGESHQSPCFYEGGYVIGKDYDISPYLQRIRISVSSSFVLKFVLQPHHLESGTYISLNFYDPSDLAHGPIPDLSHTGKDEQVAEASFVQLRAYKKAGGDLALAPLIYKKGVRYSQGEKAKYYNPFENLDAITDEYGNVLGGSGNLFSSLFIHVAGDGTYQATDSERMVLPDKKGQYTFFVHLNRSIGKKIFLIAAITKAAILPSGRGLRSPIRTTALEISHPCAQ